MKYNAIVLAGSRPGPDPFAHQFGTDLKALIAVGGEPMVRRPVRALLGSGNINQVIVLSQAPDRMADVIPKNPRVILRESRGTIAETMLSICSDPSTRWPTRTPMRGEPFAVVKVTSLMGNPPSWPAAAEKGNAGTRPAFRERRNAGSAQRGNRHLRGAQAHVPRG